MAGAAKKRAKQDRQAALGSSGSGEGSTQASETRAGPASAGGYDGPSDVTRPPGRGRQMSNAPLPSHGSRSASRPGSSRGPAAPVLRDPAREPVLVTSINRNIDLPGMAYNLDRQVSFQQRSSYI